MFLGHGSFAVHQVVIIKKHTHGLSENAEDEPEDHVAHLIITHSKTDYYLFKFQQQSKRFKRLRIRKELFGLPSLESIPWNQTFLVDSL